MKNKKRALIILTPVIIIGGYYLASGVMAEEKASELCESIPSSSMMISISNYTHFIQVDKSPESRDSSHKTRDYYKEHKEEYEYLSPMGKQVSYYPLPGEQWKKICNYIMDL